MMKTDATDEELLQTISKYEEGIGKRFATCIVLVGIGLTVGILMGNTASAQGWATTVIGFGISVSGGIPAVRNMILRDEAHAARATLKERGQGQE